MSREENREGSVRKLSDSSWECITQSKYLNPKTGNPKRFKRKGKTEKEARTLSKMARDAWEKEFEKGKDAKVNKTKTFGEYMDEFIETEVKLSLTGSGYHSYISNLNCNFYPFPISKFQLHMLNAVEFEKYYDSILKLKSKKTCSLPIQMCKRCCKWLINKSLLEENYAAQARIKTEIADEYDHRREEELKNRKKVFSYEDIQKFYDAYKNNMGQYPVVVLFLLETGMRAGEFSSLRNSNIDLEKNRIDIVETNAIRYKNNDPDDLLYPTFRNGKRRSTSSMEICFKELCNKLNIDRDVHLTKTGQQKGLCLHSLRHTADTIANTAKGANIVNTALAMGHKAITVENIYTHATEDALKTITTPSQVVLKDYSTKDIVDESKERELYEMYIKLKEKFENQES